MDKTTFFGLFGAWALLAFAISFSDVGLNTYIDIPSILIVVGGTTFATIGQFEGKDLKNFGRAFNKAFSSIPISSTTELVDTLLDYAISIKKNGLISIESRANSEVDPFLRESLNLLIDGTKTDLIQEMLDIKLEYIEERHKIMTDMFASIAQTAGAMGMVGTLIGLIAMLANLSDPSTVGPAMAVALITTLYGALISTLFAGVLEVKLQQKHNMEMITSRISLQGVCMIASNEPIGNIKVKLGAILPFESFE